MSNPQGIEMAESSTQNDFQNNFLEAKRRHGINLDNDELLEAIVENRIPLEFKKELFQMVVENQRPSEYETEFLRVLNQTNPEFGQQFLTTTTEQIVVDFKNWSRSCSGTHSIRRPLDDERFRMLYNPVVVSIGPCHNNQARFEMEKGNQYANPRYENTEQTKMEILESKFSWNDPSNLLHLQSCINVIRKEEFIVRDCYEQKFVGLTQKTFVKTMLVDCMFLIFLIYSDFRKGQGQPRSFMDGPIFTDLLMVENQIPLHLIRELWFPVLELFRVPDPIHSYTALYMTIGHPRVMPGEEDAAHHLLDFYYKCNVPFPYDDHDQDGGYKPIISAFPSATQLYESGIKFEAVETSSNTYDIRFTNGILKIPAFVLDSQRKSILLNLLSWENNWLRTGSTHIQRTEAYMFSYVFLMDSLINTKNDVALLQNLGIINNRLPSDYDAATFFNILGENLGNMFGNNMPVNLYDPMMREIDYYSKSSWWRRNFTYVKHNYFMNTWVGISVIAGSLLLVMAVLQTVYTILGYY